MRRFIHTLLCRADIDNFVCRLILKMRTFTSRITANHSGVQRNIHASQPLKTQCLGGVAGLSTVADVHRGEINRTSRDTGSDVSELAAHVKYTPITDRITAQDVYLTLCWICKPVGRCGWFPTYRRTRFPVCQFGRSF